MSDLESELAEIGRRIFQLEINTIIRPHILGLKMDSIDEALIDIATWYDAELSRLGAPRLEEHNDYSGPLAFDQLRRRADARLKEAAHAVPDVDDGNRSMLCRIREKSDQIKGIFARYEARNQRPYPDDVRHEDINSGKVRSEFPVRDFMLIRKIWEVGTERIAMQTVVQLDGDSITRVLPEHASGATGLLGIHRESVATSVSFWNSLVHLIVDVFSTLRNLVKF